MRNKMGTRAFLKSEGFQFGMMPDRLDSRLRRELDDEQQEKLDQLAHLEGADRYNCLYSLPKTLRQAHLMFSHDSARTVASFDWLAEIAKDTSGSILDLGCGSGAFVRLLADRGQHDRLVGIDGSQALVDIATENSAHAPNTEFLKLDYAQIGVVEERFDLVTSACGLEWINMDHARGDDIPIELCLPDEFVRSQSVKKQVAAIAEGVLQDARLIVTTDGRLAMMERLKTFQEFLAFLEIASEAGWRLDLDNSKMIRFADESLPGVVFKATEPHRFEINLRELVAFWRGAGPWTLPVTEEAAILAYQVLNPTPSATSQKTFPNGTMITEIGVFGDGRAYSYQYATTGFRELKLV